MELLVETLVTPLLPPLAGPNLSNLDIAFFNPGGLLGGDQDGKKSMKAVQLGRELRALKDTRGDVDIMCITESHLNIGNVHDVAEKYLGFAWIHELATSDDKSAGVSIGYRWWMPKPVDLLCNIRKEYDTWVKDGMPATTTFAYQNLSIIDGRLQGI